LKSSAFSVCILISFALHGIAGIALHGLTAYKFFMHSFSNLASPVSSEGSSEGSGGRINHGNPKISEKLPLRSVEVEVKLLASSNQQRFVKVAEPIPSKPQVMSSSKEEESDFSARADASTGPGPEGSSFASVSLGAATSNTSSHPYLRKIWQTLRNQHQRFRHQLRGHLPDSTSVWVRIFVDPDGSIETVQVMSKLGKQEGSPLLDQTQFSQKLKDQIYQIDRFDPIPEDLFSLLGLEASHEGIILQYELRY
jgi:hypothetical protein